MKTALAICYDYSTPFEECAARARAAGFDAVSLGMNVEYSGYDTATGRRNIADVLGQNGLALDNVHDGNGALATLDEARHGAAIDAAIMSIEAAAELGARKTVHHLSGAGSAADALGREIDAAKRAAEALLLRARDLDVTIAFENSWREPYMAVFRAVLTEFDGPLVKVCYDTSHDQLYGSGTMSVLREFGERLAVLHVSDNHGEMDDHMLPWEGIIDWQQFAAILAEIGYPGPMLLEGAIKRSGIQELGTFTRAAHERAQRLIEMM